MANITLTKGESLLIWRRRLGFNQIQAAGECNVQPDHYRDWEMDKREDAPRRLLGQLKPHELCLILRRRAGKTQREIASALGCSRLWLIHIENGNAPVERLCDYWGV